MEEDFISRGTHYGFCPQSRYICLAVIVGWAEGCDSCWDFRSTDATSEKPSQPPRQLDVGSFFLGRNVCLLWRSHEKIVAWKQE
ncbi:hypothetical protein NEUTE1DRAFT_118383 [Neurospora tetrasperma FGSC 2508]|uniref:Uncharacterized protein n=1 Tax=Neurospora tetrasperma (strain FGSC 2508 / ATCC MYA-4615 / P0657) TaxID=510951 RepID=F8MYG8_NEUT8|nr:uncharacterized protein NEUTE1DRAFT_118383 [Neurospora tetrasperma FGSC 2508]EGO51365.1 hypothetical protein NEUTE1DRAFT_118383 [Neurospora tetrasperma FGSC 2508]EGZ78666.1 hypothetical protein NEUTE2DRAFT_143279 [Neurospora tetrasperma FGSC 2509]